MTIVTYSQMCDPRVRLTVRIDVAQSLTELATGFGCARELSNQLNELSPKLAWIRVTKCRLFSVAADFHNLPLRATNYAASNVFPDSSAGTANAPRCGLNRLMRSQCTAHWMSYFDWNAVHDLSDCRVFRVCIHRVDSGDSTDANSFAKGRAH